MSALLVGGTFAGLLWLERRRPLRRASESKLRRDARNLVVAATSQVAIRWAETPVVLPLARMVERRRWGLLQRLDLPSWLEVPLAVALMDYTLYLWHILVHKVPFLWRFHQVHHVDLDMDASTALRFHFGEMIVSIPWRAAQVALIGVSPRALAVWQTATLIEILFHHSDVALPIAVERWLCRLIVTPRMHGIHHSIVPEEQNSNWSSGLTLWDWLHGTLRLDIPQEAITIGVPAYRDPAEVTLPKILALPFGKQRPSWQLPGDGVPMREPLPWPSQQRLA
ncbi:MAG: sterol desaturase family protein [Isosphaeraceae bacterium]|nr:sterol desaturase family protein [Isosphaeraceae bacterium]